ncbi:MAG: 50S ribosomal protein L10 [Candidatus Latescibacterota bacterium]
MPTAEKIAKVEELAAAISGAKAVYLTNFAGISVAADTVLRSRLRAASVDYHVVKNRLAIRAAEAAGARHLSEFLRGPTALAIAKEDPIAPARILQEFINGGGTLAIKSGYLEGQILTQEQVRDLAALPPRQELLGRVVGRIQSPLYGVVGVLHGLLRGLVGTVAAIQAVRDEQAEGGVRA